MKLTLFLAATLFSSLFRGIFVIALAWGAVEAGGTAAAVGQIFVISHIMNVVLGPGFGVISDRLNRRTAVILGQCLVGLSSAVPFILWSLGLPLTLWHLAAVAFTNSIGNLLAVGSLDGLLQQLIPPEKRPQAASITNGLRQGAMVAGAGGGGYLIHYAGLAPGFLTAALLCALTAACIAALRLTPAAKKPGGYASFAGDIGDGLTYLRQSRELLLLALVTALGFSAGQLSNALLPGFVKLVNGGSDLYGLIDAGWSVGGVAIAVITGWLLSRWTLQGWEYGLLAVLGASTILFSLLSLPPLLVILHGVMGAAFSGSKILADGRLLQLCREDMMGRVRANIQMLTSLFGIVMYLSPTLLIGTTSRDLYFGWGAVLLAAGLLLLTAGRRTKTAAALP